MLKCNCIREMIARQRSYSMLYMLQMYWSAPLARNCSRGFRCCASGDENLSCLPTHIARQIVEDFIIYQHFRTILLVTTFAINAWSDSRVSRDSSKNPGEHFGENPLAQCTVLFQHTRNICMSYITVYEYKQQARASHPTLPT